MFENLSERLQGIFDNLGRTGKLTEKDVDTAMREVRLALLEADVALPVVKDFVKRVKERAVGAEVAKSLRPAQQVVKIVHEELIDTLGEAGRERVLADFGVDRMAREVEQVCMMVASRASEPSARPLPV
ncbi:hypothetical protein FBR01_15835 [Anaerolineae bacterium CFX8]|nr:hypothetical protein [Anaerolineae bacterium CFX8]